MIHPKIVAHQKDVDLNIIISFLTSISIS